MVHLIFCMYHIPNIGPLMYKIWLVYRYYTVYYWAAFIHGYNISKELKKNVDN